MATQIPLPLPATPKLGREDFIVAPGNSAAVAFLDRWPDWPMPVAALTGPSGSGKSHLAGIWAERAGAVTICASQLGEAVLASGAPLVIEDMDKSPLGRDREAVLFALLESGRALVLTGRSPPPQWAPEIPDLVSRYGAMLTFPLWQPDDALLEALAVKLFADRQLKVPDSVIAQMLRAVERDPGAVRDFVARADAQALAGKRAVTLGLVRTLLGES